MIKKSEIVFYLNKELTEKISLQKELLNTAIKSRNSDTKSSAGDKHETSREMAQIEIAKAEQQIAKTQQFINHLKLYPSTLILTNNGIFFIAIAYGKVTVNDNDVYCISNAAPISKVLLSSKHRDIVRFNGFEYKITKFIS